MVVRARSGAGSIPVPTVMKIFICKKCGGEIRIKIANKVPKYCCSTCEKLAAIDALANASEADWATDKKRQDMKRDNWKLGNGIKAGDDALLAEGQTLVLCHVLKVKGNTIKGYDSGNVLIEKSDGEQIAVLGSLLKPIGKNK